MIDLHEFIKIVINNKLIVKCQVLNELTPSEVSVLTEIASGLNITMCAKYGKSIKTLSTHKRNAYKKIGVKNDVQFIHYLYMLNYFKV
ncbi:helix-turn-helix transcriptional regulator [Salmonella enterica]|nr:helix-turn-helix transcriptional regulator [Salmonella enterica]